MLETSLSLVAAFAAYTFYAIVGDEMRANRTVKTPSKKRATTAKPKNQKVPKAKNSKTAQKSKTRTKKAKAIKAE